MSDDPLPEVPPSREEFRQLEARIDARFQAVNVRFTILEQQIDRLVRREDARRASLMKLLEVVERELAPLVGRDQ